MMDLYFFQRRMRNLCKKDKLICEPVIYFLIRIDNKSTATIQVKKSKKELALNKLSELGFRFTQIDRSEKDKKNFDKSYQMKIGLGEFMLN